MHTVHYNNDDRFDWDFAAAGKNMPIAAVGLLFDVNNHNADLTTEQVAIIDNFFDSMSWDSETSDPQVSFIPYGNLMEMADFTKRWSYIGSVTTPPCYTEVYWNVLRTVYPIKQAHLDAFKAILADHDMVNNWREIQKYDGHNVINYDSNDIGAFFGNATMGVVEDWPDKAVQIAASAAALIAVGASLV